MPTKKPGPKYTAAEAEALMPDVVRRAALEAVDLMISLDKYSINSHAFESRVFSLTGQIALLNRLCYIIWKARGLEKLAAQKADIPQGHILRHKT